jgi:hypothetical protein
VASADFMLYLVSICENENEFYAYITSCLSASSCFPIGMYPLEGVSHPMQVEIVGDSLIVLDADW